MNLVFLPGASGNTEFWQPVMEKLPSSWQKSVIAYPAFGGHAADPDIQSFDALQRYVLSFITTETIVIAQSMGGVFAVQAALQRSHLIKALVLVATSGGIDLSPFHVADWRQEYQQNFDVPDWFVNHDSKKDAELDRIRCPVLLIWGDADAISPVEIGEYLQEKIPHAVLSIIKNGQHDLANTFSEQVSQSIKQFLLKIDA